MFSPFAGLLNRLHTLVCTTNMQTQEVDSGNYPRPGRSSQGAVTIEYYTVLDPTNTMQGAASVTWRK
jgi:hypothetical protein